MILWQYEQRGQRVSCLILKHGQIFVQQKFMNMKKITIYKVLKSL